MQQCIRSRMQSPGAEVSRCLAVPSRHFISDSTYNHCAVKHGDKEDLRVEKCSQRVDKRIPAFSPLRLAVEQGDVGHKSAVREITCGLGPWDSVHLCLGSRPASFWKEQDYTDKESSGHDGRDEVHPAPAEVNDDVWRCNALQSSMLEHSFLRTCGKETTYQTDDDHTLDRKKHALEGESVRQQLGCALRRLTIQVFLWCTKTISWMQNGIRDSIVPAPMAWMLLAPRWEPKDPECPAHTQPMMATTPLKIMTGRLPTEIAMGTKMRLEIPIMSTGKEARRYTCQIGGALGSSLRVFKGSPGGSPFFVSGSSSFGSMPAYCRAKTGSIAPRISSAAAANAPENGQYFVTTLHRRSLTKETET